MSISQLYERCGSEWGLQDMSPTKERKTHTKQLAQPSKAAQKTEKSERIYPFTRGGTRLSIYKEPCPALSDNTPPIRNNVAGMHCMLSRFPQHLFRRLPGSKSTGPENVGVGFCWDCWMGHGRVLCLGVSTRGREVFAPAYPDWVVPTGMDCNRASSHRRRCRRGWIFFAF